MTRRPGPAAEPAGRTERVVRTEGVVHAQEGAPAGDAVPTAGVVRLEDVVPEDDAIRAEDVVPGDDAGVGDTAGAGGSAGSGGTGGAADAGGGVGPGGSGGTGDVAERVWRAMGALVLDGDDRRKAVVDALGMSFFRAKALRRIAASPGSQLSRLAASLGTDRPYLTLVVDDLEKRGLVVRRQHPQDRRSKTVTATPEGAAAAARAEAILGTPPRAMAALSAQDLATLDRILTTLLQSPPPAATESDPSAPPETDTGA